MSKTKLNLNLNCDILLHFYNSVLQEVVTFNKFITMISEQGIIDNKIKKNLYEKLLNMKYERISKKDRDNIKIGSEIKWIQKGEIYKAKITEIKPSCVNIEHSINPRLGFDRKLWI